MDRGPSGETEFALRSSGRTSLGVGSGGGGGSGWCSRGRGYGLVIGHLAYLFLRHTVSHNIQIEAHEEVGGDRDVYRGELGRFVGKIHSLHRGKEPGDIDLLR